MANQKIIDSHIHLWPKESANEDGHAWMTPGMPLAKSHLLSDYCQAARQHQYRNPSQTIVEGVIYIETDVRYDAPHGDLSIWAKGPLDEIKFLRSIVEGEHGERDSRLLLGLVLWCPMNQPPSVLEEYLRLAEEAAGKETWKRVKGFRFLLQSIYDQRKFQDLVFSSDFITNLGILGKRGFSFDVGVDQRCGGVWQLEALVVSMWTAQTKLLEHERPVFIINHLCKPDFSEQDKSAFQRWCTAIRSMSLSPKTYMKLSGAFSELPEGLNIAVDIAEHMKPWATARVRVLQARKDYVWERLACL